MLKVFLSNEQISVFLWNSINSKNIFAFVQTVYDYSAQSKACIDKSYLLRKAFITTIKEDHFLGCAFSHNPDEFISNLPHIWRQIFKDQTLSWFVFNKKLAHSCVDYFSTTDGIVQAKIFDKIDYSKFVTRLGIYRDNINLLSIICKDQTEITSAFNVSGFSWTLIPSSEIQPLTEKDFENVQECFIKNAKQYGNLYKIAEVLMREHKTLLDSRTNLLNADFETFDYQLLLADHKRASSNFIKKQFVVMDTLSKRKIEL